MELKIICGGLVVTNNEFVLVKESKGYMTGKWNLPGGHLEQTENIHNGVIREIKEETNLDVEIDGLIGIYNFKSDVGNNVMYICFKTSVIGGELQYQKSDLLGSTWISFEDFKQMKEDELGGTHISAVVSDYLVRGAIKDAVYISGV